MTSSRNPSSPSDRKPASATAITSASSAGIVDADGLHPDLLQLAVAPGLRAFVAEERAGVAQLDRQRAAVQAVLDHRAHHAGGALRTQRHRPVAAVGEGVHLLGDDIGGLPHSAGEQRGVLEDRQLDIGVSGVPGGASRPSRTATNCAEAGGR